MILALVDQSEPLVPLSDRLVREALVETVLGICANFHPRCLRIDQQMSALGWNRKTRIDGRRERVDEFRPARIPHPEWASAQTAEVAPARALVRGGVARVLDHCLVDAQILAPLDRERLMRAAEIDGETTASRSLSANRAVAQVEGVGMRRLQGEPNRTTVAGTVELHDLSLRCSEPGGRRFPGARLG